jgi:hypothetical protein
VPYVGIQILMVGLVIAFPQMVTHYKGEVVDPGDVEIVLPPFGSEQPGLPGLEAPPIGTQPPAEGQPPAGAAPPSFDLSQPPSFGDAPAQPPAQSPDLSQPPSFD